MSFTPIGDRVLILPDQPEETTESGLAIVRDYKEAEMSGTVAFIGRGSRCAECGNAQRSDLKVGDRVVFAPETGSDVTYDGVTYLTLTEDDILGIVEDE